MPNVDSVKNIIIIAALLLPGYIMEEVAARIQPVKHTGPDALRPLRYLYLGMVNAVVWALPVCWVLRWDVVSRSDDLVMLSLITVALVGPVLPGLGIGYARRCGLVRKAFLRLGIELPSQYATAWDVRFERVVCGAWVLVTLKDGKQVYGYYGGRSVASDDPNHRDLYLQETRDAEWQPVPGGPNGIWIAHGEIRHIEVWPATEADTEAERDAAAEKRAADDRTRKESGDG